MDPQIDPSGRHVAVTYMERQNLAANSVRVLDLETGVERTLNTHPEGETRCAVEGPVLGGIWPSVWLSDGRLVSDGDMGLRLWDLEAGTSELLRPCTEAKNIPWVLATPDSQEFIRLQQHGGLTTGGWTALTVFQRPTATIREITTHGTTLACAALDPSGRILVTGDRDGVVRVGSLGGEEPHLLYGHSGQVVRVAVSPDGRWVASGSQDETLRLWPMPDLSKPPLHTLPREELLAKLKSLTNLRAVRDPESSTGWKIEVGPFPGWATVPEW
jgi:WD40 repeat protein